MRIGAFTVDAARDGSFLAPAEAEYHRMAPERWDPWRHLLVDGTHVANELGSFVVRDDERVILVDLGFGPGQVPGWNAGQLMKSLEGLQVKPEDVTDVLFSHLHFDHTGWASVDGAATFPNATYRWHEADWRHFSVGYNPRAEDLLPGVSVFPPEMLPINKLAPVVSQAAMWSGTEEILPGIEAVEAVGHSPGHCVFVLRSEGESGLLGGDIAHHQAELLEAEDWQGAADADEDAKQARCSRLSVRALLAETGMPTVAAHFMNWEWGRVVESDSGFDWEALQEDSN